MVFVDQAAEALPTHSGSRATVGCRLWRAKFKSQMRPLTVVVIEILMKNEASVLFAKDEQLVEGFVAQCLDHALAVGVGARLSVGSECHPGTVAAENVVKLIYELGVPVVDRELNRCPQL